MDDLLTILEGDALEQLRTLPDASVNCCVTSPPYWGLRDYGTGTWEGGDQECAHEPLHWDGPKQTQGAQSGHASKADRLSRKTCRCGAVRVDQQIGLEETPEAYVARLVEVFREVNRVLRDDGTLWLNLGDSYNAYNGNRGTDSRYTGEQAKYAEVPGGNGLMAKGLKQKDLVGIPWRVAFALQADGWYLRQDIIWAKKNCMPESVTDRCTKSHEYVFLLSKAPRYYYDAEAIKEPVAPSQVGRVRDDVVGGNKGDLVHHSPGGQFVRARGGKSAFRGQGHFRDRDGGPANRDGRDMVDVGVEDNRNRRDVWTIGTKPYPEAHFAVWPEALVQPMILAGCPEGGVVLDPFAGSGTTGAVALKLGRRATLIELNPAYVALIRKRCRVTLGLPGLG